MTRGRLLARSRANTSPVDGFPGKGTTAAAPIALLFVTIAKFLALARKSARSVTNGRKAVRLAEFVLACHPRQISRAAPNLAVNSE
jgi:hypothetical protein